MNHDGHNNCQHTQMAYCRMCDAAYCRACSREWPQRVWNWTYQPYTYTVPWNYGSTTGTFTTTAEAGTPTTAAAACNHT